VCGHRYNETGGAGFGCVTTLNAQKWNRADGVLSFFLFSEQEQRDKDVNRCQGTVNIV
jgi:hypothetical protein